MQEELQRLLVDEAEEAEANCTVDELLSALRKTHRAMTVEESALRAFLKVLDEDGVIIPTCGIRNSRINSARQIRE